MWSMLNLIHKDTFLDTLKDYNFNPLSPSLSKGNFKLFLKS